MRWVRFAGLAFVSAGLLGSPHAVRGASTHSRILGWDADTRCVYAMITRDGTTGKESTLVRLDTRLPGGRLPVRVDLDSRRADEGVLRARLRPLERVDVSIPSQYVLRKEILRTPKGDLVPRTWVRMKFLTVDFEDVREYWDGNVDVSAYGSLTIPSISNMGTYLPRFVSVTAAHLLPDDPRRLVAMVSFMGDPEGPGVTEWPVVLPGPGWHELLTLDGDPPR